MARPQNDRLNGCCPCSVRFSECATRCGLTCVPRYLCVNATLVPSEGPCCDELSFRIPGGCGWSGGASCQGGSEDEITFLWVIVEIIENVDGTCDTKITSNALGTPGDPPWQGEMTVTGIGLFSDGTPISFSGANESGTTYEVTITRGGNVTNNLQADMACSPCVCTRCIPEKLCAEVTLIADVCGIECDSFKGGTVLTLNTATGIYESLPIPCGNDEWTVALRVPDCDDRDPMGHKYPCGLLGRISGPGIAQTLAGSLIGDCDEGCMDFFISWEGRDESDPDQIPAIDAVARGDTCKEGDYSTLQRGDPLRRKWKFLTIIQKNTYVLELRDNAEPPNLVGYFSIRDLCCGGKCPDDPINCVPGCPDLAPRLGLNLFPCPPVDLTATLIAPGCEYDGLTITMSHNNVPGAAGCRPASPTPSHCILWGGDASFNCANLNAFTICLYLYDEIKNCGDPDTASNYLLSWVTSAVECPGGGVIAGQAYPDGDAECDPFIVEFTLPKFCFNNFIDPIGPICGDDPGCDSVLVRITK